MPTAPFPVSRELVAVAVAYRDPDNVYIADRVLPRLTPSSPRKEFKYLDYDAGTFYSVGDNRVGRVSSPKMVDFESSEKTGVALDYGFDSTIPHADIREAQANGYNIKSRRIEFLTQMNKIAREKRVADLVFAAGSYPVGFKVQLAGGDKWSAPATSDPIGDINAALDAALMPVNRLVFGQVSWRALSTHPNILKAVNHNDGDAGNATKQAVADLFGVKEVLVGAGRINSAKPGQAAVYTRLWGSHCALLHINETADNTAGVTFGYTYQVNASGSGSAIVAGEIDDPKIGLEGATIVRSGEIVKEIIVAPMAGYFIQDAA
jgi:hypothetical protein